MMWSENRQFEHTWTHRQGLQPLFVELSLLTRHPEGEAGEREVNREQEVRTLGKMESPLERGFKKHKRRREVEERGRRGGGGVSR